MNNAFSGNPQSEEVNQLFIDPMSECVLVPHSLLVLPKVFSVYFSTFPFHLFQFFHWCCFYVRLICCCSNATNIHHILLYCSERLLTAFIDLLQHRSAFKTAKDPRGESFLSHARNFPRHALQKPRSLLLHHQVTYTLRGTYHHDYKSSL